MKIAILNLGDINEVKYTIDFLKNIHEEIIAAKIDLFVSKNVANELGEHKLLNSIVPLDLENLNIFNFNAKQNAMEYYKRKKYNIAIDTQATLKSAYFTYLITGRTAGFKKPGLKGKIISSLYDEKYDLIHDLDKKENTKVLLSNTFGFGA